MFFLHRLGIVIIPIDELIFSEGLEPPTRVEFDEFNVGSPPLKEYIMWHNVLSCDISFGNRMLCEMISYRKLPYMLFYVDLQVFVFVRVCPSSRWHMSIFGRPVSSGWLAEETGTPTKFPLWMWSWRYLLRTRGKHNMATFGPSCFYRRLPCESMLWLPRKKFQNMFQQHCIQPVHQTWWGFL